MPGAVVVATGEVGEVMVERGGPLRVVGYAAVGGYGRPVAGLEVVAEVLRAGELVHADCFAAGGDAGHPVAEQRADVGLATPQRRWLSARRRRRGVGFHGGEHLADEAFGGPAEQADGAARAADPDQFVGAGLVMRGEHDAEA